MGTGMPDLDDILVNLGTAFPWAANLVLVLMAVTGIVVVGLGLIDFYNMAALPGRHRATVVGAVTKLLVGAAMTVATILMWQTGNTLVLTGGNPADAFTYLPPTDESAAARCESARSVVVLAFVFIGCWAWYRGFLLTYQTAAGTRRAGARVIATLFIAGTVCLFLTSTSRIVGNTLGLNAGINEVCRLLGPQGGRS